MPLVEPMTPVFERAKTVHALDHAAIVLGSKVIRENTHISITLETDTIITVENSVPLRGFRILHLQAFHENRNFIQTITFNLTSSREYNFLKREFDHVNSII
jgi:hypothetical protein